MRKLKWKYLWAMSVVIVFCTVQIAGATEWEDLVQSYSLEKNMFREAEQLKQDLIREAHVLEPELLWRSLSTPLSLRQKAANSLSLLMMLCDGHLERWESVEGFWYPHIIPRSLALMDGFYSAVVSLSYMPDTSAHWLAFSLLKNLRQSSRGKLLFLEEAPQAYIEALRYLQKSHIPVPDYWIDIKGRGHLPLVRRFEGVVSYGQALSRNMFFLDAVGRLAANGVYAWDRETGGIYEIARWNHRRIFFPWND